MNMLRCNVVAVVTFPLLVAGFFLSVLVSPAAASVACFGDINNKNIGLEFIATTCQTDTASIRTYIDTAIQCTNGEVELLAPYGDTLTYPGTLVYSLLSQGYRVFGDQYGNHIIAVHSNFGSSSVDTIDGKQMSSFAAGQFYSGVFEKILYPPAAIVDADNDHYTQCGDLDCDDNDPSITTTCTIVPPEKIDHGKPPCRIAHPQMVVDPINIFNGNNYQFASDLIFGSLGIKRTYNSRSSAPGVMGYGWSLGLVEASLDPDFDIDGSRYVEITDQTGRGIYFFKQDETTFLASFHETTSLTRDISNYVWHRHDGSKYIFDENGRLVQTTNPVGNSMIITYNADNLPASVSDESTGRVVTFGYNASNLIEKITGPITAAVPDGIWVTYGYDSNINLTSVTYADGSGFTYEYNDTNDIHNLTGKKDKQGHTLATWGYDEHDKAFENYTPDGRGGSINYIDDTLVEVTDAKGVTKVYAIELIDGRQRISSVAFKTCATCPTTSPIRYEYDSNLNVTEKEFANGRIDTYSDFDPYGNAQVVTKASGTAVEKSIQRAYHPETGGVLSSREPSVLQGGGSKEIIFDYDDDGNSIPNENPTHLVHQKIEKGYTWNDSQDVVSYEYITTYTYNDFGQITSVDGPLPGEQDKTLFAYFDTSGDLHTVTSSLGTITYGNYDDAGNPGFVTDFNNQTTTFIYDGRNRLISTTRNGITNGVSYNQSGDIESTTDGENRSLSYMYNPAGLLEQIVDGNANALTFGYDSEGNITERTIIDGTAKRYYQQTHDFDNPDQPGTHWKTISHDNDETVINYDVMGNVLSIKNGRDITTTYNYNLFNQLITSTEAASRIAEYDYDNHGNLTLVTDPEGLQTSYIFDDYGNLLQTVSTDSGTTLYRYDEYGRLQSITDANNITVSLTLDSLGRQTLLSYPTDPNHLFIWDTDTKGKLSSMQDGISKTSYSYDNNGNITTQTVEIKGRTYHIVYEYDATGQIIAMTYPGGRRIAYQSDSLGRTNHVVTTVSGFSQNIATDISYTPFGPLTTLTYGNGLGLSMPVNESFEKEELLVDGTMNRSYGYYAESLVNTITDNQDTSKNHVFVYDDYNRLASAQGAYGTYVYDLDDNSNRLSVDRDAVLTTYDYLVETNILNGFTTESNSTVYEQDARGNTTRKGDLRFIYNEANRLVMVEDMAAGNTVIAEYGYNSLNQRIFKKTNQGIIYYIYDIAGNLIIEDHIDSEKRVEYIWLYSQPLAQIQVVNLCGADMDMDGDIDGFDLASFANSTLDITSSATQFGQTTCQTQTESVFYYHVDHLGTPQLMTDNSSAVVWAAEYLPFGLVTVDTASTVENNFRFPGQYWDGETGLHYNWHRYYDPETGRYMTPDSLGVLPDGPSGKFNHLYAYVDGNPINFIDPKGLKGSGMECFQKYILFAAKCGACLPICESAVITGGATSFLCAACLAGNCYLPGKDFFECIEPEDECISN